MRLILFDIDGTLIDSGGAGTRSLDLALKELFSIDNAFHGIIMAGKTDTQIIKEGLAKHGLPIEESLNEVVSSYLKYLQGEINNDRKHIKPGIIELLTGLKGKNSAALGLLTGNLEQGARIKLEPFGLNEYFSSGAFGSDDEDRNNLLPIAVERFEGLFQRKIEIETCVIVGDTPRDVECAHIYGAICIGVATGPYPIDALIDAGADYVFNDLSDHQTLRQLFDI
jgi:phosphoglycolate phosphatase-like HAD superfamily hydrolase